MEITTLEQLNTLGDKNAPETIKIGGRDFAYATALNDFKAGGYGDATAFNQKISGYIPASQATTQSSKGSDGLIGSIASAGKELLGGLLTQSYGDLAHDASKSSWDAINKQPDGISKSIATGIQTVNDFLRPTGNKDYIDNSPAKLSYDQAVNIEAAHNPYKEKMYKEAAHWAEKRLGYGEHEKKDVSDEQAKTWLNELQTIAPEHDFFIVTDKSREDYGHAYAKPKGSSANAWAAIENSSIWQNLKTSTDAHLGQIGAEVGFDVAGGMAAAKYTPGGLPMKAGAALLGGYASSALAGDPVGVLTDKARLYAKTGVDETPAQIGEDIKTAVSDNLFATPLAMGAITGGIAAGVKGAGLIKSGVNAVRDYALNENINGAMDILRRNGYTQADIDSISKSIQEYQASSPKGRKQTFQDILMDVAYQDPNLWHSMAEAIDKDPAKAKKILDLTSTRAENLSGVADSMSMDRDAFKSAIGEYEAKVSSDFGDTLKLYDDTLPYYKFDLGSDVKSAIEELRNSIGDSDVVGELNALLYRIDKNGDELGVSDLLKVRQDINSVLRKPSVKKYDDKSALHDINRSIDSKIDDAIGRQGLDEQTKIELGVQFDKVNKEYAQMIDLQDSYLYKKIFDKNLPSESDFDKLLFKVSQTEIDAANQLISKLSLSSQANIQSRIIGAVTNKFIKDANGAKYVDWNNLGKALSEIKYRIDNPEVSQYVANLQNMAKLFKNDEVLTRSAMGAVGESRKNNIATTLEGKFKMSLMSKIFNILNRYHFTEGGKYTAFEYHLGEAINRSRTPKELLLNTLTIPDAPRSLLDELKPIVRAYKSNTVSMIEKLKAEHRKAQQEQAARAAQKASYVDADIVHPQVGNTKKIGYEEKYYGNPDGTPLHGWSEPLGNRVQEAIDAKYGREIKSADEISTLHDTNQDKELPNGVQEAGKTTEEVKSIPSIQKIFEKYKAKRISDEKKAIQNNSRPENVEHNLVKLDEWAKNLDTHFYGNLENILTAWDNKNIDSIVGKLVKGIGFEPYKQALKELRGVDFGKTQAQALEAVKSHFPDEYTAYLESKAVELEEYKAKQSDIQYQNTENYYKNRKIILNGDKDNPTTVYEHLSDLAEKGGEVASFKRGATTRYKIVMPNGNSWEQTKAEAEFFDELKRRKSATINKDERGGIDEPNSTSTPTLERVPTDDVPRDEGTGQAGRTDSPSSSEQRTDGGRPSQVGTKQDGGELGGNEEIYTASRGESGRRDVDGQGESSEYSRGNDKPDGSISRASDAGDTLPTSIKKLDGQSNVSGIRLPSESPKDYSLLGQTRQYGGAVTKYNDNIAAIQTLKQIESEGRLATPAEQETLSKYVGWGGLPQAFDMSAKGWESKAQEVRALLSDSEYKAARSSTLNAHYTPPEVVSAIWEGLSILGLRNGKILEPSMGIGNFFMYMPLDMKVGSKIHGVELDPITAKIAAQLSPNADIKNIGFEAYKSPNGYFDAIVGNPPFGDYSLLDSSRPHLKNLSIHNFFMAKSVDLLAPNGVMSVVITNHFLDAANSATRELIAKQVDLVGAVRLPNNAFSKNAGTEVTTDVLFFKKRATGEESKDHSWVNSSTVKDPNGGEDIPLNEYFIRNPGNMLGEWGRYGTMYGGGQPALIAKDGVKLDEAINSALENILPKNAMRPSEEPTKAVGEKLKNSFKSVGMSGLKLNALVIDKDGNIARYGRDEFDNHKLYPVDDLELIGKDADSFTQLTPVGQKQTLGKIAKAKEKLPQLLKIRELLYDLRAAQLDSTISDSDLTIKRGKLGIAYDNFVKKYGNINSSSNRTMFEDDPSWYHLSALENEVTSGDKVSFTKADILKKRTQFPIQQVQSVKSAKDALVVSLAENGRVDAMKISNLLGKDANAAIKELEGQGLVFRDTNDRLLARDEYLSGNVKEKLSLAKEALTNGDERFKTHIAELEKIIPEDIEAIDIQVSFGSHWLPENTMKDFFKESFEYEMPLGYSKYTREWTFNRSYNMPSSLTTKYGASRASVIDVMEHTAKRKRFAIYDEDKLAGTRTYNAVASDEANLKVAELNRDFKEWIWQSAERRDELGRLYNDLFNTTVERDFDGSHLTFPGKVSDDIITLRPHQKNAAWRISQSDSVLLDHSVGFGKTMAGIAGMMELKRLGIASKPMIVVPNHLTEQWAKDFLALYPGADVLTATKKDFSADGRKRFMNLITTGDWDAVIVGHSQFGRLPMSVDTLYKYLDEEINMLTGAYQEAKRVKGSKDPSVKDLEKYIIKKQNALGELTARMSKDRDNLNFEELGVDALLIDEAHEFKNLRYFTMMDRIGSMGDPKGSQKANDLFLKTQWLREKDAKIVFMTGTPISNSMVEMYNIQRYLDLPNMQHKGWDNFDAWAHQFAETVTDYELTATGKFKLKSRLAKFVNIPELISSYRNFADVKAIEDLEAAGIHLPRPSVKGGKPTNIVLDKSDAQSKYFGEAKQVERNGEIVEEYPEGTLNYRASNLPKDTREDNMLKIFSDARKASLDMRLINSVAYGDHEGSKTNTAAKNIKALYDKWSEDKGTQIIFCDLSTPKKGSSSMQKEREDIIDLLKKAEAGDDMAAEKLDKYTPDELDSILEYDKKFSVYDDLKSKLTDMGIPSSEIAFIHDANTDARKAELFAKVNSGDVRVIIGSTSKMGAGTNIQERLVAMHHLDVPWRPSDLEQREGRIIRQGNKLYDRDPKGFEIEIARYATKETLDSAMWQTIETKAKFISQVKKGSKERSIEDFSAETMSAAEMKAASSGNPKILEEMKLRDDIRKLESEKQSINRTMFRVQDSIKKQERLISYLPTQIEKIEMDMKAYRPPKDSKSFIIKVDGKIYDKREDGANAIAGLLNDNLMNLTKGVDVGELNGMNLYAQKRKHEDRVTIFIKGAEEYEVDFDSVGAISSFGAVVKLENEQKRIAGYLLQAREGLAQAKKELPKLKAQLKPFAKEDELKQKIEDHAQILDELKPKRQDSKK